MHIFQAEIFIFPSDHQDAIVLNPGNKIKQMQLRCF